MIVKGKVQQAMKAREGGGEVDVYICTLSLTSALYGGGWSTPRPSRFTTGEVTRYALYGRVGGPQGRSGRVRKNSPPPEFDPRTVQPVASRYIDYVTPAHGWSVINEC